MVTMELGYGDQPVDGGPAQSVEEFKRALLAAKAIVYAGPVRGGAAGIHAGVIEKLGLTANSKSGASRILGNRRKRHMAE